MVRLLLLVLLLVVLLVLLLVVLLLKDRCELKFGVSTDSIVLTLIIGAGEPA